MDVTSHLIWNDEAFRFNIPYQNGRGLIDVMSNPDVVVLID